MKFNKIIAAISAVTMLGSMAIAVPASAADTDAYVSAYDNFRVNTGKSKVNGDITYYGNAHIGNVLTGEGYNGGSITKTETAVSNRFYNLMRITIPSGNTKSVTVSVTSASNNRAFEIYSYSSTVEWKDLPYTDNNHAGVTDGDYQTYYDASAAAGYDWSGLGTNTFSAVSPITTATTAGGKLTFTLSKEDGSLTDADLSAGHKDILIKNASGSTCNFSAPEVPTVTTVLEEVADPAAKIGSTEYATFSAAYAAANDGDEIVLLKDVSYDARVTLGKAVTIKGSGQTITSSADILITKNVTIDGVNVTTAKQAKLDQPSVTATVKNATVTGGIYMGKGPGTLVLDNVNVDKIITRNGNDEKATVGTNAISGTGTVGEIVYYSDTDTVADTLTVTTLTDTYVAPEPQTHSEYFSFAGDESVSYNAIELTASNGTDEQTRTASIMAITGASEIAAEVANIPEGIAITGIVLTSVAAN